MEGGMMVAKSFSSSSSSVDTTGISILVVDDDTTCLTIIAAILKKLKYKVVTVKNAMDALYTLGVSGRAFDLVVSDVHMPDMNGFDLQRIITEQFNLPVVLMSADEKESIASKSLEGGAVFFLFKPISQYDLKDLWQFAAINKRRNRNVVIEETAAPANTSKGKHVFGEEIARFSAYDGASSTSKKEYKKKNPREEGCEDKYEEKCHPFSKRPKIVWSISLHHRFLDAINSIGLDKAVPKKILAVMNVPGLTRENVASHLQKYRIFLRRVAEASFKVQYASRGLSMTMNPSDESSRLMVSRLGKWNHNFHNRGNFDIDAPLPNPGAQSTLYGQSRLLSNNGTRYKPPMGSSTLAPPHPGVRLAPYSYGTRASNQSYMANPGQNHSFGAFPSTSTYGVLTQNSLGSSNVMLQPMRNMTYQTNYTGHNLSNVQSSESFKSNDNKYGGSTSIRGIPSFFREEPQPPMEPISLVESFEAINNRQTLVPNVANHTSLDFGLENGGEILESTLSPILDLPEFNTPAQQGLDEGLATTWPEQFTNVFDPPLEGDFGGETNTSSNIHDDDNVVLWDSLLNSTYPFDQTQNHQVAESSSQLETTNTQVIAAPSQINETVIEPDNEQLTFENFLNSLDFGTFPQLNNNVPSPMTEQYADDDFLNSLLDPNGEDNLFDGAYM